MMVGTRSLKNTAEITPRLAVLPSAWPYERASVVNSKRRASVWLVCHPLIVTVSYGPMHPLARVGRGRFARVNGVESIDRQRHGHTDGVRVTQPNGIFPPFQRLDVPAPVMRVTWLKSAVNEDVYLANRMA